MRLLLVEDDANLAALGDVMEQWTAAGPGYNARVTALAPLLNATTVHDDTSADQLTGGSASDWFFANTTGPGVLDVINGLQAGEIVTEL